MEPHILRRSSDGGIPPPPPPRTRSMISLRAPTVAVLQPGPGAFASETEGQAHLSLPAGGSQSSLRVPHPVLSEPSDDMNMYAEFPMAMAPEMQTTGPPTAPRSAANPTFISVTRAPGDTESERSSQEFRRSSQEFKLARSPARPSSLLKTRPLYVCFFGLFRSPCRRQCGAACSAW